MYGVSDAYKTAMHQAVQRFRLTGTVGTTEFTDENILSGSFSVTNQCSGNNEIQIGQVYVGELDATFLNLSLTRYSLKGMQIAPSFGLRLADGTYEDVPLGVFNISEAGWTMSGLVVKAYDNMSLLDKNCNTSQNGYTCTESGYEIFEPEAEAVRLVFRYYNGGMMISDISRRMEAAGYRTARGQFSRGMVLCILRNDFYLGRRVYPANYSGTGKEETVENDHPAIISRDAFEKAKVRRESDAKRHNDSRNH